MDMEYMFTPTGQDMKVNGRMTSNMERAKRHGKMEVNTMVTMLTPKKKEKECINGLMEISILETGKIMPFMDTVSIFGTMEEHTVDNGKTI
jgi:hypothetical protein